MPAMKKFQLPLIFALGAATALNGFCAGTNSVAATNAVAYAPAILPGKGLAQHPFLLTGEADSRNQEQTLFVVRDGKVAWTYSVPLKTTNGESELGDATML